MIKTQESVASTNEGEEKSALFKHRSSIFGQRHILFFCPGNSIGIGTFVYVLAFFHLFTTCLLIPSSGDKTYRQLTTFALLVCDENLMLLAYTYC
jgi:hypothetical protein